MCWSLNFTENESVKIKTACLKQPITACNNADINLPAHSESPQLSEYNSENPTSLACLVLEIFASQVTQN